MTHSFVAYIDESGDPGFRVPFRANASAGGASHFLILGAYVVTSEQDDNLVQLRDQIRNDIKPAARKRDLHFADLGHQQKVRYTELLAQHPAHAILAIFNKARFQTHTHFLRHPHEFYWYACRYLVERISWLCDDAAPNRSSNGVKLCFSNRGGQSYGDFSKYLRRLQRQEEPTSIRWRCIDPSLVETLPHGHRAGLQLADGVTSAVASAVEPQSLGVLEPRYGLGLKPIIYRYHTGKVSSYGIKVMPDDRTGLTEEQRANIAALCE